MKRLVILAVVFAALSGAVVGSLIFRSAPPKKPTTYSLLPRAFEEPRSSKWPAVRRAHLAKESACIVCGRTDDLQVHHILEFRARPDLELDPSNLCTLCGPSGHNHHLIFGHLGNYRWWNPNVREDAKRYRDEVEQAKKRAEAVP